MTTRRANGEGSKPILRKDGRWGISLAWTDQTGKSGRTTVYGKTAADARTKAKAVTKRLDRGQTARDAKVRLGTFAQAWITSTLAASDRKETTKALYGGLTRTHIIGSELGGMTFDRIKPGHIEAWMVGLRDQGKAPSTVRSIYTVLRAILDTAVRDQLVAVNHAAAIKRPTVPATEAAHLTPEQVRTLRAAAASSRYAPLFTLLVHTGLRRGEALALQWRDVDFETGLLRVRGTLARVGGELVVTDTKTKKSNRFIHLSPATLAVLREVRQHQRHERIAAGSKWISTPYVFTTEFGQPCDPRNALRALKSAAATANLPGVIGLHTLRHSAATVMLTNGIPLKVVSDVLGHSSISITGDVYGHVSPEVSSDALDTLSAALEA